MNNRFDLTTVLRPHIQQLVPYSSARDEYTGSEGIFLDANENPFGSAIPENYNRYPDPYQKAIKDRLSTIKKVSPERIFLGNGSDEAIDLLIRATCIPGTDNLLIMPPTYGMYEVSAAINDVALVKVPLTTGYQIDTDAVLKAITPHTKIVWICSPNNPSANLLQTEAIRAILEQFTGMVVVDEAYIDFSSQASWTTQLDTYPNLVVIQTFSKAWGLAALRTGMCFASAEIIRILNKIKPPYNISGPAQELLLEALHHPETTQHMVVHILEQREWLRTELGALPIVTAVHPSDANFLLVKFTDAAAVMHYLLELKIIVRDRSRVVLCDDCLRITVGTASENGALMDALKKWRTS